MDVELSRVKRIRDAATRAGEAASLLAQAEARVKAIREVQDAAAVEMLAKGATYAEVARTLRITRSAVAQRFSKP